jgi:hypothetical protein
MLGIKRTAKKTRTPTTVAFLSDDAITVYSIEKKYACQIATNFSHTHVRR